MDEPIEPAAAGPARAGSVPRPRRAPGRPRRGAAAPLGARPSASRRSSANARIVASSRNRIPVPASSVPLDQALVDERSSGHRARRRHRASDHLFGLLELEAALEDREVVEHPLESRVEQVVAPGDGTRPGSAAGPGRRAVPEPGRGRWAARRSRTALTGRWAMRAAASSTPSGRRSTRRQTSSIRPPSAPGLPARPDGPCALHEQPYGTRRRAATPGTPAPR